MPVIEIHPHSLSEAVCERPVVQRGIAQSGRGEVEFLLRIFPHESLQRVIRYFILK